MDVRDRIYTLERHVFKAINAALMVPLLRAGLGWLIGSPATGYVLLLTTTGRKSGLPRETPLNYAIDAGEIVVLAGFGEHADWLKNILHTPHVRVRLPDRLCEGVATRVVEPAEARRLAVAVARNSGFALVFEDPRCLVMSDAQLADALDGRPVVRIRATEGAIAPGPHDPGGRGWVLPMLGQALAALFLIGWLRRRRRT